MSTEVAEGDPPAPPEEQKKPKSRLHFLRELPALVLIALVLALLIKTFLIQAFYIPSDSMDPTLKVGDRVLVEKVMTHPHRKWIVVFTNPHPTQEPDRSWFGGFVHWLSEGFGVSTPANEDFIKRVIALPGETVDVRAGIVYIDGERLDEPYLNKVKDTTSDFGPCTVPHDRVFVMGDNRTDSNDSRYNFSGGASIKDGRCIGAIRVSTIVGRAIVKVWPPSRMGFLH